MTNFFNNNDLIIVVDNDICPNDKEKVKFMDLQENIITLVANFLDLVEDEYKEFTLKDVEIKLEGKGKKLDDFIKFDIPNEFKDAQLVKYNPIDIHKGTITCKVRESAARRNFIVLDKFLEKNENLRLLKEYLSELSEIISEFYIGIVFYSSNPNSIKTLEEAKNFLNSIELTKEQIEKLSMYVNFVDKKSTNKLMCFETVFRKSQNYNLISLYSESYSQTIQELKEKMWDINNNETLIHYDYLTEGMHLDDIFYEIFQSRFNKIYNEKCFAKYEEYINPVRKAIQIYESNKIYEPNLSLDTEKIKKRMFISRSVKILNNMLKQETYLSKCKKSDDIRFGDIVKLNNSYYMVVTQDCDLCIRLLGGRKSNLITLIRVDYSKTSLTYESIEKKLKKLYAETFEVKEKHFDRNIIELIVGSLKKMNIDETTIDNIFNTDRKDECDSKCQEINVKVTDNRLYHIDSLFLDCIILNCILDNQGTRTLKITKETIDNSKEIRLATKEYIMKNFKEFIDKYSKLQYQTLKEISDQNLISDLLPIEFVFDLKNKLMGFSIDQDEIQRMGRIDYIKAYDIFKEFMGKYSRFSYNSPPLI